MTIPKKAVLNCIGDGDGDSRGQREATLLKIL
ncbi:hypothetical protein A2U01_0094480, partial [Trifolium medium]|nr:hypothetical protein [Trifolium medium]